MASTLGTGFFQPQARPGGVTIAQERMAEEIAPFMKDYLEREAALANLREEEGYIPYESPTIAEYTPEQIEAQRGLLALSGMEAIKDPDDLLGTSTEIRQIIDPETGLPTGGISGQRYADAEDLIRRQAEEFTGETAEKFMSPFQQAVTDIERREAQRTFEKDVIPKLQRELAQAQSFSGSRGALLESLALRDQGQLLSDIQSKGLQSAYDRARQEFKNQKSREAGQAQALIGLSPAEYGQKVKELGGIERVGAVEQTRLQKALDEDYKEFLESEAFPESVLDRMQSAAYGFPALRQRITQNPTTFGPSPFATLASGVGAVGTGIGNLFGQLGGKKATGKHGGIVSRQEGGLVNLVNELQANQGKLQSALYGRNNAGMQQTLPVGMSQNIPISSGIGSLGKLFNTLNQNNPKGSFFSRPMEHFKNRFENLGQNEFAVHPDVNWKKTFAQGGLVPLIQKKSGQTAYGDIEASQVDAAGKRFDRAMLNIIGSRDIEDKAREELRKKKAGITAARQSRLEERNNPFMKFLAGLQKMADPPSGSRDYRDLPLGANLQAAAQEIKDITKMAEDEYKTLEEKAEDAELTAMQADISLTGQRAKEDLALEQKRLDFTSKFRLADRQDKEEDRKEQQRKDLKHYHEETNRIREIENETDRDIAKAKLAATSLTAANNQANLDRNYDLNKKKLIDALNKTEIQKRDNITELLNSTDFLRSISTGFIGYSILKLRNAQVAKKDAISLAAAAIVGVRTGNQSIPDAIEAGKLTRDEYNKIRENIKETVDLYYK